MRVVLSGGGTGGHIYPAISIAEQCRIRMPDCQLLYIGSQRGLEKDIVPKAGIPFKAIEITGFKRSISWDNIKTVMRFLRAVKSCKAILKQFNPDIVVGTGGYVCGPVIYAAAKLGIPTLIHEQNVLPGLTNRFLSKHAMSIAVSFQDSKPHFAKAKRVLYTGNPCATAVVQANADNGWASLNLPPKSKLVIIVGGSGGAQAINEVMIEMAEHVGNLPDVHFVYVTGESYYQTTKQALDARYDVLPDNLHVMSYIYNMPEVLAASSLIVNRSGASFTAEITALGLPSILIPSPNVTNNHQEANARSLADAGAAVLLLEKDLHAERLFSEIEKIMSNNFISETMAQKARQMGKPDAAECVLDEMLHLSRVTV